jgi:hypothetical protein
MLLKRLCTVGLLVNLVSLTTTQLVAAAPAPAPQEKKEAAMPTFRAPMINLYSRDLSRAVAFYLELGFVETFRTPASGEPVHIELTKDGFTLCFLSLQGAAQSVKGSYPRMAPLEQYLMDRDAENSMARSAAPASISGNAEILVFTRHGFETAVKGTNGFVCMVARSWSAYIEDPDFWNPKLRVPICYNALAAWSQVAVTIKRTKVVLARGSKAQVFDAIKAAIESKELPTAEPGAMADMMSRQTFLSVRDGSWLPHLMFFTPETDPKG